MSYVITKFYRVDVEDRSVARRWVPEKLCSSAFAWLSQAQAQGYDTEGVVDVFEDFGGQMMIHRIPVELLTVVEQV